MPKLLAFLVLIFLATCASAQSREHWIRKCQAEGTDLTTSNGYRVCTELYVMGLEKKQRELLSKLAVRLASRDEDAGAEPVKAHLQQSQDLWRDYVTEHCQIVQAVLGDESPVGDAVPSCEADQFELRNAQLSRLLVSKDKR